MRIREAGRRRLQLEALEARLVLSCDFSGNGICGVEDLDILYEAGSISVSGSVRQVSDLVVQDFYISTNEDISAIQGSLVVDPNGPDVEIYNHPEGSDTAPPSPAQVEMDRLRAADSWVRTPGGPVVLSGTFSETNSFGSVTDAEDTGPVNDFHFATIAYRADRQVPFEFVGDVVTVAADGSTRTLDFSITFPGQADRLNFDRDIAINEGDIPGWLASASVASGGLTYRVGDVNLDGDVNSEDLGVVLNNFSQRSHDLSWGDGDLNMSGTVDSEDLGLVLNGFGFESLANSASVNRAADAVDAFAGDLYEELQKESGNVVFSPLSISTAFGVAYAAARGQTATEIAEVMHFGDEPGIHEAFSNLLESYEQTRGPSDLSVANSLWPDLTYPVREEYIDLVASDYRAEVQNLDYAGDTGAAEEIIDDWVAENTNDRIQNLVKDKLTPQTVLVIANAMHFESLWEIPFQANSTSTRSFVTSDGTTVDAEIMRQLTSDGGSSSIRIGRSGRFDVMEILFRGGAASMLVMLPHSGGDMTMSADEFSDINVWADQSNHGGSCIGVELPRFATTVDTDLSQLLPAMGMPTAFTSGEADLTGAFFDNRAYIEDVAHKAFISVDETGVEAAAVTSITAPVICFSAGTPVMTPSGPRPIEEIEVGDYVLSRNEDDPDGQVVSKRVEELFQGDKPVIEIQVSSGTLRPTQHHPFFVKDRGWTSAVELQVGDLLSTIDGDWIPVEVVTVNPEVVPVYNFRVADFHTYFVGDTNAAVWAHNCCSPRFFFVDRPFHFAVRDNINSTTIIMGRIDDPTAMSNRIIPTPAESLATVQSVEPNRDAPADSESFSLSSLLSPVPPFRVVQHGEVIYELDTHEEDLVWNPESLEPSVDEGLSYENFVESLRQVQSQWRFVSDSVDEAIQDDSLSLDWVDSIGEADEVMAAGLGSSGGS